MTQPFGISDALVKRRMLDVSAGMARTKASHAKLADMLWHGTGNIGRIAEYAGIPRDVVRAMALEDPWMPWSCGMCHAVDEEARRAAHEAAL